MMPVASQTSLAIAQVEASMLNAGIDRYARRQERLSKSGAAAERDDYSSLIRQHLMPIAQRVQAEIETQMQPRVRGKLLVRLNVVDPETIAYIALSTLYSSLAKTNSELHIATSIGMRLNDEVRFGHIKAQNPKLLKRLVEYAEKQHGSHRHKASFVFNTAAKTDVDEDGVILREGITTEVWSEQDHALIGKFMLHILQECGLIETSTVTEDNSSKRVDVSLSEASLAYLEQRRVSAASGDMVSPVYTPMTTPPKDWTGPMGGGYHTLDNPLVRGAMATQWDMPQVYRAVNMVQSTAWRLNRTMFEIVRYMWANGIVAGKLPSSKIIPKPERMDDEAFKALSEVERKAYLLNRREVYDNNRQTTSDMVTMQMILAQAEELVDEPEIYLPYFLDYRGRAYCAPMLNPQGSGYMRSMFEFAHGKRIGDAGAAWVGIQVATEWDGPEKLSKAPFDERLAWTEEHEELLRAVVADPMGDRRWMQADKPFMFLRSAMDWVGYLDNGEDHISRMAISIDGACSGIQHYSAMLRNSDAGSRVNLLPSKRPADVYHDVATVVIDRLANDEPSPERDFWLALGVSRKTVKKPTMTYGYSSRLQGFTEWYDIEYVRNHKPKVANRDKTARYLARHTLSAVEEMLPSVHQGMDWLQTCVKLLAHEGKGISWRSPSGFPVTQCIPSIPSVRVETVIGGERLRISIPGATKSINKDRQKNAIGPNFVHSMDAAHLMLTVLKANEEYGITEFSLIHDSFGTLAADADGMFAAVREAFVEMYEQNDPLTTLYDSVCEALSPEGREKLPFPPERGDLDITQVAQSLYAFA